jgi:hypothetical protein
MSKGEARVSQGCSKGVPTYIATPFLHLFYTLATPLLTNTMCRENSNFLIRSFLYKLWPNKILKLSKMHTKSIQIEYKYILPNKLDFFLRFSYKTHAKKNK